MKYRVSIEYASRLLICIGSQARPTYISEIMKMEGKMAMSQVYKTFKIMEQNGLIKSEKKKRERYVELTDKGKELFTHLVEVRRLCPVLLE